MSYYGVKLAKVPFGEDTLTTKIDEMANTYETDSEAMMFASDLINLADGLRDDEFLIVCKVVF